MGLRDEAVSGGTGGNGGSATVSTEGFGPAVFGIFGAWRHGYSFRNCDWMPYVRMEKYDLKLDMQMRLKRKNLD